MSVFGPFYPATLQAVVNHAERLSELLSVHELAPPTEEWAKAWATGRADEIARFTEHVVELWRAAELADGAAATMLDGYLTVVHEGLARHLRCEAPPCCVAATAETAQTVRGKARARPARANHAAAQIAEGRARPHPGVAKAVPVLARHDGRPAAGSQDHESATALRTADSLLLEMALGSKR